MSTKRRQKNLTVMFTDISGFTKHTETISREDLMSRLDTHNELLMPIIAHFDGEIVKTIGDAFLITFESPTNAVQCGLFMQHTLRKHNADKPETKQIHIKVSINSGEVTVTDNDVFGDPVNVAAKIEKATNPDEIYFTESVFLAMNKAEVPTSFVKNFRPKGADSTEIKLYKVAMDEGDERYQKIVTGTNIDADKNKTKVLELSNTAEKEFIRYQDTLEALVESQGKSSRGMIIAVILAAVILAGAVIAGFAVFTGGGESEEQKVVDSARLFLSNGKPDDARELLLKYVRENGNSEDIESALEEVNTYELNRDTERANEFLAAGRPDQALALMKEVLKKADGGEAQQQVIRRAEAYMGANQALADGDTARAREQAKIAAGTEGLTDDLKDVIKRADALDDAREITEDEERLKIESNKAIEKIAGAWGNEVDSPIAQQLLIEALKSRLYWEGRNTSLESANELLDDYKERFTAIGDWRPIAREVDLGAFWRYVYDFDLRKNWWQWHSTEWSRHYQRLKDAGKDDAEFLFRVGVTIAEINTAMHVVTATGQFQIEEALELDPGLFDRNRDKLLEICRGWLRKDMKARSFGTKLILNKFYDELRPELIEGLTATYESVGEIRPNNTVRENAFCLMADRMDLGVIEDPFGYFRDNLRMLIENNWPEQDERDVDVRRDQVKQLLALPISADDYREYLRLFDEIKKDVDTRSGFGAYKYASSVLNMLREDLREAHPEHAHIEEE